MHLRVRVEGRVGYGQNFHRESRVRFDYADDFAEIRLFVRQDFQHPERHGAKHRQITKHSGKGDMRLRFRYTTILDGHGSVGPG
jgi:hypothetical protein